MKLNRIFTFATLAAAMFFTTSCNDTAADYAGPGAWDANENYADVYFKMEEDGSYEKSETVDPSEAPIATFNLYRRNATSEQTIPLTIVENTDDVFEVSDAVFAAGDTVATVTVNYAKAGIGTPYKLVVTVDDPDYVSSYTSGVFYTYTVTRVKWNDVGYIMNGDEKVEGYAMYTEDFMTTFYAVENLEFPTRIQERDDMPGYFRLINTYHELYPYNDPGDWDDSKDYYIYIDATDPEKVFIEHFCQTGLDWGYGMMVVSSYAGYYLYNAENASSESDAQKYIDAAEAYYGTYENGIITFPEGSLLVSMPGMGTGGLYLANNNGAFKIVLDPTKDVYTATLEDYDWEPVFTGDYTSTQLGTKKEGVTLYKGVPKDDVEAANEGCYERFEAKYGGTPYFIESPYANGKNLLFLVNGKNIVTMADYEYQEIGMTSMNKEICANILASSQFTENTVNLDIQFQTEPDSKGNYIDYGTATETLEYVSWTQVGTGTYTYTAFFCDFDEDGNPIPEEDGPLDIYQRDDQPNVYKITHWGYDVDFTFTWDGEDGDGVTVPTSATGAVHPQYGPIYVSDIPTWSEGGYTYEQFPCSYDAETSTFSFAVAYWDMDDPSYPWGVDYETLQVTWGDAAPAAARAAKAKNLQVKSKKTASNLSAKARKSPFANGKKTTVKSVKTLKPLTGTPVLVK